MGVSNDPGQQGPPQYYRPGPSSGAYPQYPQNPYPQGWTPGMQPAPYPQQAPDQAGQAPQWNTAGAQPAGLTPSGRREVTRPRQVVSALILLIASALPFVFFGIAALLVPLDGTVLNDDLLAQAGMPRPEFETMLAQAGMTATEFLDAVGVAMRVFGAVVLVLGLAYIGLGVAAFRGSAGARLSAAIVTGVFGLVLFLFLMLAGREALLFAVLVLAVAAGGITLLYSAPAKEWYASRRVGAAQRPA
ncbi:hypothetical protein PP1_019905 [Pseudonocardia sp. P1]